MANIKFKIELAASGVAFVNIIEGEEDSIWEIQHPETEAIVDIPDGDSRYAFINVLAPKGNTFKFYQDNEMIFEGETNSENAFADYVIVHA
jgi:hypothetical protein